MITAILKVHVSNGIWAAEGGFEFPLVLLTVPSQEPGESRAGVASALT
jgi:hypothetical protein